jgi:hypothetical protein
MEIGGCDFVVKTTNPKKMMQIILDSLYWEDPIFEDDEQLPLKRVNKFYLQNFSPPARTQVFPYKWLLIKEPSPSLWMKSVVLQS